MSSEDKRSKATISEPVASITKTFDDYDEEYYGDPFDDSICQQYVHLGYTTNLCGCKACEKAIEEYLREDPDYDLYEMSMYL